MNDLVVRGDTPPAVAKPRKAGLFAGIAAALGLARDELATVRAQVAALKAEVELEESRPVPLSVAEEKVDKALAYLRQDAAYRVPVRGALVRGDDDGGDAAQALRMSGLSAFAIAAVAAPDGLRAWMLDEAKVAMRDLPEPVDRATREARLAELHRKLDAAERQEADLCWQSFDNGMDPEWRGDLSPAAALGLNP
jgi:hypothetical protein